MQRGWPKPDGKFGSTQDLQGQQELRQGLASRVGVEMGLISNRYKWQIPEGCPLSRNEKDSLQRNHKESRGWQKDTSVAMKSHTSIPIPKNHLEKIARIKHLKEGILAG